VPSRPDARRWWCLTRLTPWSAVGLTALLVASGIGVAAGQRQPPPRGGRPTPAEISRAIDIVKADPNLTPERTFKTLRWKDTGSKTSGTSWWIQWMTGLFEWLGQSARLLVWAAAAALAGMLVVSILRMVRDHAVSERDQPFVAPTHVRDLDIRPETLPPDVGAAARLLWDGGDHRTALALLYRGLLSRLVHVHRLAIHDSSTEGDCLQLSARHLTSPRHDYASRLIGAWQRAVYGHEDVAATIVHALCDDFAPALDAADREPLAVPGAA
jgi:hypothetical protein